MRVSFFHEHFASRLPRLADGGNDLVAYAKAEYLIACAIILSQNIVETTYFDEITIGS